MLGREDDYRVASIALQRQLITMLGGQPCANWPDAPFSMHIVDDAMEILVAEIKAEKKAIEDAHNR